MMTLKNLVHKGVKVDLGMPYELWDEPSVEVSDMKKQVSVVCLCMCACYNYNLQWFISKV